MTAMQRRDLGDRKEGRGTGRRRQAQAGAGRHRRQAGAGRRRQAQAGGRQAAYSSPPPPGGAVALQKVSKNSSLLTLKLAHKKLPPFPHRILQLRTFSKVGLE